MQRTLQKPDYILITVTFILVLIGLLMIFSASFTFLYLQRQLGALLVGLLFFFLGVFIDYHGYKRFVIPLLILTAFLLLLTYIPGFGHRAGGASRWINLGGLVFQPSELAKMVVVFFLALALDNKGKKVKEFWLGIGPILLVVGGILGLIVKQPDLGTTLLIAFVTGVVPLHL